MLKQTTLIVVALFCVVTSCSKFETLNEPEFLLQQNKITADEITETTFEGTFQHGDPIPGQYIVVFKDDAFSQTEMDLNKSFNSRANIVLKKAEKLIAQRQLAKESIYQSYGHALKGFAVKMNETQALEIAKNPLVEYVEQDRFVILGPGNGKGNGGNNGGTPPPQSTPWGITRVGGHADGTGTTAWVIDSGIDLDHPDLNVNTGLSQSFLSGGGPNQSADDQHGHGTHVAGTIGAIDNSEGVVGVAANATVISVRVLDRKGSGSTSGVIAGVNYVAANAGSNDVANMSLGGGISTTLDNAVIAASNTCRFVLAAGPYSFSSRLRRFLFFPKGNLSSLQRLLLFRQSSK